MFTMNSIGHIKSPYEDPSRCPKASVRSIMREGIIVLRPELASGLEDIDGFSHLYVCGCLIASTAMILWASPPLRHPLTWCVPLLGLQNDLTQLGSPWWNWCVVMGPIFMCAEWICLIERRCWTSNPNLSSVPFDQLKRGWLAEVESANSDHPKDRP